MLSTVVLKFAETRFTWGACLKRRHLKKSPATQIRWIWGVALKSAMILRLVFPGILLERDSPGVRWLGSRGFQFLS